MLRIAAILLLFVLLTEAPHVRTELPIPRSELALETRPVVVPLERAVHGYGPLRLYGLWQLSSANEYFGGISSLLVADDGRFLALDDSGEYFDFGIARYGEPDHIGALPRRPHELLKPHWQWDSESMTRDATTGRIWVGFERLQRICRYSAGFERIERCVEPAAMQKWKRTKGIESLVRIGDGRFLAIEEGTHEGNAHHQVLLWAGDPVEPATPPPVSLSYVAPVGYLPTDALWLGGDRMLVLNRKLGFKGFVARIAMVRLPRLVAGATLRAEPITDFAWPGPSDNMEAMALGKGDNGPVLWVASDDNHWFFEKTLLFSFSLPRDWVSERPAPGGMAPPAPASEASRPTASPTQ